MEEGAGLSGRQGRWWGVGGTCGAGDCHWDGGCGSRFGWGWAHGDIRQEGVGKDWQAEEKEEERGVWLVVVKESCEVK